MKDGNASSRRATIVLRGVVVGASGSAADRSSITLPPGFTEWVAVSAIYRMVTAAGTLAAGTFGIYTQAAAAGTTIVTAAALTAMTAADKTITPAIATQAVPITDQTIYVRQTVDAANAGTMDVYIDILALNP